MATCHEEPVVSEESIPGTKVEDVAAAGGPGHNIETVLSLSPSSAKILRTCNESFQSSGTSNLTDSIPSLNASFQSSESASSSVCHSTALKNSLQSSGSFRVSMAGMIESLPIELSSGTQIEQEIRSVSSPSTAATENTEKSIQDKITSPIRKKAIKELVPRKSILKSGHKRQSCKLRVSFNEDSAIIRARARKNSQAKVDPQEGTASLTLLLSRDKNTWDLESGNLNIAKNPVLFQALGTPGLRPSWLFQ